VDFGGDDGDDNGGHDSPFDCEDGRTRIFFFCGDTTEEGEPSTAFPPEEFGDFLCGVFAGVFIAVAAVPVVDFFFFLIVDFDVIVFGEAVGEAAAVTAADFGTREAESSISSFFELIVLSHESFSFFLVDSSMVAVEPATLFDLVGVEEITVSNWSILKCR